MNAKQWYQRSTWGMESLQSNPQFLLQSQNHFMNSLSSKIRPKLFLTSHHLRALSTSFLTSTFTHSLNNIPTRVPRKTSSRNCVRVGVKVNSAQLKRNWLASISYPLPDETDPLDIQADLTHINAAPDWDWVIGIDPDASGALAMVKSDESGYSAQVFDSPHLQVKVGNGARKRLDVNSITQLLRSLNAPIGTTAYIEQSLPFPKDGKQGWWCGGFNYGLWIGVLVASGFSVVPVPSMTWKKKFKLSGSSSPKNHYLFCSLIRDMDTSAYFNLEKRCKTRKL